MKKFLLYASVATAVFAAGCDDFGDLNESPNANPVPLTSALLTNSLTQLGTAVTGGPALASGFYAQYFTQTQYTETSRYTELDVNWSTDIAGPIADLQEIIDINTDPATAPLAALQGSNNNQIAIARILKAYRFSVLTDRYGDMPYFEALDEKNLTPVFNTQQDIYKDIFKELDEAVTQFDAGDAVKGDILYTDTVKVDKARQILRWKKFANSLRLVLALRVSKVDQDMGKLQFNDALASDGGVFTSNFDNAQLLFPGNAFKNPWFAIAADQGVAATIADHLNNTGDARRNAFGKPSSGTLIGVPYGMLREDAIDWTGDHTGWSLILNDDYRKETSKFFIFTYADVLLARAEAEERGWTDAPGATSVDLHNQAIMASWQQWGVYSAAAYNNYIADTDIAFTPGTADALEKIATQRWVTFYPNGPQGWAEWRRTGFPELIPTADAANTSKVIPTRFKYPSVEYGYNATNINAAAGTLDNGDNDNSHVWWDK
jgi:hypothetical protein